MVTDLVWGVWRHSLAGRGRKKLKNIEENGGMALGRISLMAFPCLSDAFPCLSRSVECCQRFCGGRLPSEEAVHLSGGGSEILTAW
jgi:hypothetical protein